jgi:hypothetical protein
MGPQGVRRASRGWRPSPSLHELCYVASARRTNYETPDQL